MKDPLTLTAKMLSRVCVVRLPLMWDEGNFADMVTEKLVERRGNFLSIPVNTPDTTPVHNPLQFNLSHDLTNKQVIKFLEEATAHGLSPSSSSATYPRSRTPATVTASPSSRTAPTPSLCTGTACTRATWGGSPLSPLRAKR